MGYAGSIRRSSRPISLAEWRAAVSSAEGVRLKVGDLSITNPKTGEIIGVPNSGGDAEVFDLEQKRWIPFFFLSRERGEITFRLTPEFEIDGNPFRAASLQLASSLNAKLIGDDGEEYV